MYIIIIKFLINKLHIMNFIWNHINNLIDDGLLSEKNPYDVSYILMLDNIDDMRDVSALLFENYIHTHALIKTGKYKYLDQNMLRDFEINGINIEVMKNLRISGGHVKTSSYNITCQTDLKQFRVDVLSTMNENIIKACNEIIKKK